MVPEDEELRERLAVVGNRSCNLDSTGISPTVNRRLTSDGCRCCDRLHCGCIAVRTVSITQAVYPCEGLLAIKRHQLLRIGGGRFAS